MDTSATMNVMSTNDQDLPEEIRQALLPVRRDLTAAGIALPVEVVRPKGLSSHLLDMGAQHASVRLGGRVVGQLRIDLANTGAQRTWHLADQVQDYVLETPWAAGAAVTWPRCLVGHAHPMKAQISADDVAWVCPRVPSVRVPVGLHPGRFLEPTDLTTAENVAVESDGADR